MINLNLHQTQLQSTSTSIDLNFNQPQLQATSTSFNLNFNQPQLNMAMTSKQPNLVFLCVGWWCAIFRIFDWGADNFLGLTIFQNSDKIQYGPWFPAYRYRDQAQARFSTKNLKSLRLGQESKDFRIFYLKVASDSIRKKNMSVQQ